MADISSTNTYVELTTVIVSAYVKHNSVPMAEVPGLIRGVHQALTTLGVGAAEESAPTPLKPAVPIKRSVTDDFIISLEDGRKMKSMKRYLFGLGMTPAQYREKWGLPNDYPMVAPSYAAKRSALARTIGLGRKARVEGVEPTPVPDPVPDAVVEPTKSRRKAA